ncbi:MAG: DUF4065 domain-containing protein [Clostridia bacterium]|nr:DUF4065 domain-containing protein [Clostridia bacterium]
MYAAIDLSKYIVAKCINDGHMISNLQLQKILFYIQKTFLQSNKVAFRDEIEAWRFGPVVPNVYYHFCGYGAMPISNVARDYGYIDYNDMRIIDGIVNEKRDLDPWILVAETHKPNGAWNMVYNGGAGNRKVIPVDLIRSAG